MSVCKIVRSSQRGGDVHPPGTDNGPVAPKSQEKLPCPDEKQHLPCPQEKQRGSCTALTEKQRVAALRPKNSNGDTSLRVLESYVPKRLHGCGFILLLLVFFFVFLVFAALVPRPAYYQLPVGGPDHPARPALGFRWRRMPVATDMFRSYDAAAQNPSIPKDYTALLSRRPTLAQGTVVRRMGHTGS